MRTGLAAPSGKKERNKWLEKQRQEGLERRNKKKGIITPRSIMISQLCENGFETFLWNTPV